MGKKILIIVATVVIIAGAAAVWWLFATERLVYRANPGDAAPVGAVVCDDDMVSRYNLAASYELREGSDEPGVDTAALTAIRDEIKTLDGYENDPSCQAILFQVALVNDDYEAARTAYEAMVRLHDAGHYPNNNIWGDATLNQNKNYLQGLTGYDGPPNTDGEFDE